MDTNTYMMTLIKIVIQQLFFSSSVSLHRAYDEHLIYTPETVS